MRMCGACAAAARRRPGPDAPKSLVHDPTTERLASAHCCRAGLPPVGIHHLDGGVTITRTKPFSGVGLGAILPRIYDAHRVTDGGAPRTPSSQRQSQLSDICFSADTLSWPQCKRVAQR